jgi:hypothetical protein
MAETLGLLRRPGRGLTSRPWYRAYVTFGTKKRVFEVSIQLQVTKEVRANSDYQDRPFTGPTMDRHDAGLTIATGALAELGERH